MVDNGWQTAESETPIAVETKAFDRPSGIAMEMKNTKTWVRRFLLIAL